MSRYYNNDLWAKDTHYYTICGIYICIYKYITCSAWLCFKTPSHMFAHRKGFWNSAGCLNRIVGNQDIFQHHPLKLCRLWSQAFSVKHRALLPAQQVLIASTLLPVLLPCDSLVHQTLLKSVRQPLVHQAVADKGSAFPQRRLQLQHIEMCFNFSPTLRPNQQTTHVFCNHDQKSCYAAESPNYFKSIKL